MSVYTNNVIDEMGTDENPGLTSSIYTQLNERLLSEELEDSLKSQYMEFEDLGYDFLKDYDQNVLTPEILTDMIDYIDDNYLGIEYRYQINDHDRNTYTFGPMLYSIICVDMVNFILPNMLKELGTKDINDIKVLDANTDFKFNILKVVGNILSGLEEVKDTVGYSNGVGNNIIKYSFCLDLFDNDLEDFMENYIIPICNKYDTLITNGDV